MRKHDPETGVSLRRLIPESVTLYAGDVRVTSCTSNARGVRPGDTYVALDTAEADGHDFVEHAIRSGAEAVIVERAVPQTRVPMCLVPDTRKAYGRLCQALAGDPSESVSCIGVTGTDGKTVASRLVHSVLREGSRSVGIVDDLGTGDSARADNAAADRTAPELAAALGEMSASHASHAVLEVSSRALSEHVLSGVQLDAACFTNLTQAHLSLHNSVASYRRVKARLMEHLRPGGICVLNRDDPMTARLAAYAPGPVLTYGMQGPADVTAEIIERHAGEQSFLLTAQSQTVAVRTRLAGDHHVENCLLAATVALAAGIDLAAIARGIERVAALPGRLERVAPAVAPQVYVDTSGTPTALAAALAAVRSTTRGRVWCVAEAPTSGEHDELCRYVRAAARLADAVFLTAMSHDTSHCVSRLPQLLAGLETSGQLAVSRNRTRAIQAAIRAAAEEDVVLIVGGHRQLAADRRVARTALERSSNGAEVAHRMTSDSRPAPWQH